MLNHSVNWKSSKEREGQSWLPVGYPSIGTKGWRTWTLASGRLRFESGSVTYSCVILNKSWVTFLSLHCLICKMGKWKPTSETWGEDAMSYACTCLAHCSKLNKRWVHLRCVHRQAMQVTVLNYVNRGMRLLLSLLTQHWVFLRQGM